MLVAVEIPKAVLEHVSGELQAYVYMLVDPESGIPFYVGKGHGLRHAAHLAEALIPVDEADEERSRKPKRTKIGKILARGLEPEVWILRHGLKSAEYTAVEAASIDLLMSFPLRPLGQGEVRFPLGCREQLTNARREDAHGHGVTLLQTLIDDVAAPELTTTHPILLITLNGWHPDREVIAGGRVRYFAGWKPEWLASSVRRKAYDEIGESVSAWWSVDPHVVARGGIEHVAAVHRGVTRALFRIEPGSWETKVFGLDKRGHEIRRAAFWFQAIASGPLFNEVIGPHGHRVPPRAQGAQNSIHYWPHHPYKS